jgi:hypothetical protein
MFWKRKDGTRRYQPEDEVHISNVQLNDGNKLEVTAVYKGKEYVKHASLDNSRNPEDTVAIHLDWVKQCVVASYRYEQWEAGVRKVVEGWNT